MQEPEKAQHTQMKSLVKDLKQALQSAGCSAAMDRA